MGLRRECNQVQAIVTRRSQDLQLFRGTNANKRKKLILRFKGAGAREHSAAEVR
jgi:hypothetical protein